MNKYRTLVKFDLNGQWSNQKPIFSTYEDLDEIFRIGFELYEDFKKALKEAIRK